MVNTKKARLKSLTVIGAFFTIIITTEGILFLSYLGDKLEEIYFKLDLTSLDDDL